MMDGRGHELIAVARIARPRGLYGEVVADPQTDFPERFAVGAQLHLQLSSGEVEIAELASVRWHQGRILLRLVGIDSVEQAERLRGAVLSVTRDELALLPDDTYYDFDLVGCRIETASGEWLGTVCRVDHYGAAPLLVVDGREVGRPAEMLVPFATAICPEVDLERRRIVVTLPEGLLD
jgi:16S rRNA processing protein RimM